MIIILPECGRYIPRLMTEEPASTAEGQFVRRMSGLLECNDPFGRSWTLAFVREAFNELNRWFCGRAERLGVAEKRRLLEYEEGGKVTLDPQVSLQSAVLTLSEKEPALAAWLVEHVWEMRDHRTGRSVAFVFLGPQMERALLGDTDYELVSDARGASFFFKAIAAAPTSGRPFVRFSEGNRCRFWSTHIRLLAGPAPEKEMCEQAKALIALLPTLEDETVSPTDRYTTLNMCLDMALAIWRWSECGSKASWRTASCISTLLASVQRKLDALQRNGKEPVLTRMAKTVQFHTTRAISGLEQK